MTIQKRLREWADIEQQALAFDEGDARLVADLREAADEIDRWVGEATGSEGLRAVEEHRAEKAERERDEWRSAYTQALGRAEAAEQELLIAGAYIRTIRVYRGGGVIEPPRLRLQSEKGEQE